jgi:diguanylate cyclase (GGDEF)-like protein
MGGNARGISRILDTGEAESAFGRELLKVRYRALQRQIPLVYSIVLANVLGFHFATGPSAELLLNPINLLVLVVLGRLAYWLRTRHRQLPPERIRRELQVTLLLAGLFSAAGGYWAIAQLVTQTQQPDLLVLFTSLAAIGCAYGLSSFPTAARLPLLLYGLPFSVVLTFSPNHAHIGIGVTLVLITLMTLRLVNLQNRGLVELVRSRSVVDSERERARQAEAVALAEKARVRRIADTDPLTGLANRRAFLAALEARLDDQNGPRFALALIDLDGFKPINDTFGHAAGDAVLIQVAERLQQAGGKDALTARIGGDEFAMLFDCGDETCALTAGAELCGRLGRPYPVDSREFRISACCGITFLEPGAFDVSGALHCGDAALYSGKQKGRGCVALFTPELQRANERRSAIERALRARNVARQFSLVYQPIFDLKTGAVLAFEALARWQHPELGTIAPSEFIPITEQINVIEEISDVLLARAAREATSWPDSVHLSFNLSAVQLCSGIAARRVLEILRGEGLDPERLHVEVTETSLLADFETARANLDALRAAGARIVLDDFGAGYASISYLREMRFDAIKLDGALITGATSSPSALRLLKGVLELCASMNMPCVAEHIEAPGQIELLTRLGCRGGQGFALSQPLAPQEARALAEARLVEFAPRRRGRRGRAA